jgi:hypothetical protein
MPGWILTGIETGLSCGPKRMGTSGPTGGPFLLEQVWFPVETCRKSQVPEELAPDRSLSQSFPGEKDGQGTAAHRLPVVCPCRCFPPRGKR